MNDSAPREGFFFELLAFIYDLGLYNMIDLINKCPAKSVE
jgi:hypothetical protein